MSELNARRSRPAAVAGLFYPADRRELDALIASMMDEARNARQRPPGRAPFAIVAPHAGFIYSGQTAARAYQPLARFRSEFQRVLILGPAHRVAFQGIAAPSAATFRTPLGMVPVDTEAIAALDTLECVSVRDDAHAAEHCIEVHLPFLQRSLESFTVIPLIVGAATPEQVADVIRVMTAEPGTLVVVSSDLSHYLDDESAKRLDHDTLEAITKLNADGISDEGACGRLPIKGLIEVAKTAGLEAHLLDHRTSGDTAGDKDRVVGYASIWFQDSGTQGLSLGEREVVLHVAGQSIRHGLANGHPLSINPDGYAPPLGEPGASFVTLKLKNRLRGCIGSLTAQRPLVVDVADNAFAAAFRDPRFPPLNAEEFAQINALEVSVLSAPTPIAAASKGALLAALRPGIDGLIVREGDKRATFLPQVWQQVPHGPLFLEHLWRKAGLPAAHWSPKLHFWTYQTQSFALHTPPRDRH
jgi:AmmeMemoRadiSam system protein B/AmmeMemoRadiSam system protein A